MQVLLSGDPSKLNRELDRIDSRAGQTERTHSAAWSRIGAMAGAAIKSGMVVATGAVVGLGAAIKQGLNMANFTEQAEISFGTLLGSATAAKTYLGDLQKFAAATPFELPGVVEGAQKLLGVGAAAESVIPTLTAWGDASGALGLNQEKFGRVLTAVTQMMGKGKVSAEEMLQITEAGIPIWMLLAKATGKPVPELQKLASEGKLLAEDVLPLLEKQMNADYGGSMAKQAQTLSGVWSTAKDNLNLALRDAVLPLAAGLKTVLPDASAAAADAIRSMGLRMSQGLLSLIQMGADLREQYGPELGQLGEMAAKKWAAFVDLLHELGSAVAPSLPAVVDSLLRIAEVGADVGQAMLPVLHTGLKLAGPAASLLAGALGAVADVLETLEPILPVIVGGFMAFRGISAVTGGIRAIAGTLSTAATNMQTFAVQSQYATTAMTGSVKAGERVGTTFSTIGKAMPLLAVATLGLSAALAKGEEDQQKLAAAAENAYTQLRMGGEAANQAREQLSAMNTIAEKLDSGPGIGSNMSETINAAAESAQRAWEAMSPLEQAQQKVTLATNNLQLAQERYGVNSQQAAAASGVLQAAQAALEGKQRDLANATQTATDKMLAQTQAALAGANADLAASMAQANLTTATDTYKAALADSTLTTTQRQQATDAMTQSALQAAQAAGQQAAAHSRATTEEGKQKAADAALLASLQATAKQLGSNTPAAITNLIGSMRSSGVIADTTAQKMRGLGLSVTQIPGSKSIQVNAPTEDQRRRLEGLGLTVKQIPGTKNVTVTATTASAQAALDSFIYTNSRRSVQIRANIVAGTSYMGMGGVPTRASGGPVKASTTYLVGEEGQELFVPDVPGTIIDAKKTAAMLAAAGNERASAMLPHAIGGSASRSMSLAGGPAGTGPASVGGVTEKHYHLHAAVTHTITLREFMRLQQEVDALHG